MSAMMSFSSDLKNIISCKKKRDFYCLNSAFSPLILYLWIHGPKWIQIRPDLDPRPWWKWQMLNSGQEYHYCTEYWTLPSPFTTLFSLIFFPMAINLIHFSINLILAPSPPRPWIYYIWHLQVRIKFLILHPWGWGGSLTNPLGKKFKLWRGEGNLMAFGKNITWKKG